LNEGLYELYPVSNRTRDRRGVRKEKEVKTMEGMEVREKK
jgi:hypothetical protein